MKVGTTKSYESVPCQRCGDYVPKRDAVGVGGSGRMVWTCFNCVKDGAMDDVFTPIGKIIRALAGEHTP